MINVFARLRAGYRHAWLLGPLLGCSAPDSAADPIDKNSGTPAGSPPAAEAPASTSTIVFVGTSLTAGLGLDPSLAYPAVIQAKVDSADLPYRVVNAGVSGETSAGALRRIDWLLGQGAPSVIVVETGANDGLRGQSPDSLRANIEGILDAIDALDEDPIVLLAAMEAMPNLGADYVQRFRQVYLDIAAERGITLIPFFLDGVAGVDSMNQADGIHPNRSGAIRAAENVWRVLGPKLTANREQRTASGERN